MCVIVCVCSISELSSLSPYFFLLQYYVLYKSLGTNSLFYLADMAQAHSRTP